MGGGKKTKGRQKVELKKIENAGDRQITFSKRRSGIYKKASELVTLCGAQVGVLVFSPAGRAFSYGHPSFETVAQQFLHQRLLSSSYNHQATSNNDHPIVEAYQKVRVNELSEVHNQLVDKLEVEKVKGKALAQTMNDSKGKGKEIKKGDEECNWWQIPMEKLSIQELERVHQSFLELSVNLEEKIERRKMEASSSFVINPSMVNDNLLDNNISAMVNNSDVDDIPATENYNVIDDNILAMENYNVADDNIPAMENYNVADDNIPAMLSSFLNDDGDGADNIDAQSNMNICNGSLN